MSIVKMPSNVDSVKIGGVDIPHVDRRITPPTPDARRQLILDVFRPRIVSCDIVTGFLKIKVPPCIEEITIWGTLYPIVDGIMTISAGRGSQFIHEYRHAVLY